MTKIDLHIHSNYSDGSNSISELAEIIKTAGLEVFALTDHDTVSGCDEMTEIVSQQNIKFIKGVEFTCITNGIKCHILGFGCDVKNKKLLDEATYKTKEMLRYAQSKTNDVNFDNSYLNKWY